MDPSLLEYYDFIRAQRDLLDEQIDWDEKKEKGFIPPGTALNVLKDNVLVKLYDTLSPPGTEPLQPGRAKFIEGINGRRLHDFLATMLLANCLRESWMSFVQKLLVRWPESLPDPALDPAISLLPLDERQLQRILATKADVRSFLQHQQRFTGIILRMKTENDIQKHRRNGELPYLDKTLIGTGSCGTVYRVRIAKGHLEQDDTGDAFESRSMIMALKTLEFSSEDSKIAAEREGGIMNAILNNPYVESKNVVPYYGSISTGLSYSILMSLGDSNLRKYMEEDYPLPPDSRIKRRALLESATGLALGLRFLHEDMKTRNLESIACYHLDLKPTNVIVKGRLWQISDFGLSRIKYRRSRNDKEPEHKGMTWFRNRTPQESSFSTTAPVRAEGTYQPPEATADGEQKLTKKSDVWSLGCILLNVLAYIVGGWAGLDKFIDMRMADVRSRGTDIFFIRRDMFPTQSNSAVTMLLKTLGDHLPLEADILRGLGISIKDKALRIKQDQRCDAASIVKLLEKAVGEYFKLDDPIPSIERQPTRKQSTPTQGAKPSPSRGLNGRRSSFSFFGREAAPRTTREAAVPVASCEITPGDAQVFFRGCAISDDVSLIAYWTRSDIYIYGSLFDDSNGPRTGEKPALAKTNLDKAWRSVALTGRRLVACSDSSNICYIFDLRRFDEEPPQLGRVTKIPLSQEVYQVAITPNGLELACVVGSGKFSHLLYFEIRTLLEHESAGDSGTPTPKRSIQLQWEASHIARLEFADEKSVFLVVKPDLFLVRVDLSSDLQIAFEMKDRGHTNVAQDFYTCFIPYGRDFFGAAVTVERYIHLHVFTKEGTVRKFIVPEYRIVRLLFARRRRTLYALGAKGANSVISLLELTLPTPDSSSPSTVEVRKVAQLDYLLHGSRFVAKLEEFGSGDGAGDEDKETYVLVASFDGRRRVYNIRM